MCPDLKQVCFPCFSPSFAAALVAMVMQVIRIMERLVESGNHGDRVVGCRAWHLTHWGHNEMADIFQIIYLNSHFLVWSWLYFDLNFTAIFPQGFC